MTRYALDRNTVRRWDEAIANLEDGKGGAPELLGAIAGLAASEDSAGHDERTALELLDSDWDPMLRPLLIAGLLRIIATRNDLLEPKDARIPFFKALASWAPDAVFKAARVKPSEQGCKLETALQDTVIEALRRLTEVNRSPVAPDAFRPYRTAVMKALRSPMAAALIEPFVPLQAVTTRLDAAFSLCESFFKSSATETIGNHERAVGELDRYKSDVAEWGTRYGNEYLVPIVGSSLRGRPSALRGQLGEQARAARGSRFGEALPPVGDRSKIRCCRDYPECGRGTRRGRP